MTRISARKTGFEGGFAALAEVAVRGVEVVEAVCDKFVHHLLGLLYVDCVAVKRQAHAPKTEILLHFAEKFAHNFSLLGLRPNLALLYHKFGNLHSVYPYFTKAESKTKKRAARLCYPFVKDYRF